MSSNGHIAAPVNHWRWLVIYEDDHQHLEDDELTGEWQRALANQGDHGRIVALQIIGASTATVSVPEDATPVMRRRRAIHFEVVTGKQWQLDDQPMIVGWENEITGSCYLYCYPNGEILLTDDLNVGAGDAAD